MSVIKSIFEPWNRSDEPGYVVGIAHENTLILRDAFGLASLEHGIANTATTRMRIGSISKQFTCLALFLLQERGELDVDASVRRYLPELPITDVEPTLRQLMNHTGGYRDYLDLNLVAQGLALPRPGATLAAAVRQSEINFVPGERMIYNNGGYHLLSLVIERVSGVRFAEFLSTSVFEPLGMVDTASVPDDLQVSPRVAACHVRLAGGKFRRGVFPSMELLGEGAIISTVDDMLRWSKHLRGEKKVGSADTWRQMMTRTAFGEELGEYACGLIIGRYRGAQIVHHAGGLIGGAAQLLTMPEHALDIVFMTNGEHTVDPMQICRDVIDQLLGDRLAPSIVRTTNGSDLNSVEGFYLSRQSKDVFEVVKKSDELYLREMGIAPKPLLANGARLEMEASVFGPTELDCSALPAIKITQCGQSLSLTRLSELDLPIETIAARVTGDFVSADLAARATVSFDGAAITLHVLGLDGRTSYAIEPIADHVFRFVPGEPYGTQTGFIVTDEADAAIERFWLGTFASRRIAFTRVPLIAMSASPSSDKGRLV